MTNSNYKLIKTETGRKAAKFNYKVIDAENNIITERNSNREYVACTIDGSFFFGRLDLIGKGDHGSYIKYWQKNGMEIKKIAYL